MLEIPAADVAPLPAVCLDLVCAWTTVAAACSIADAIVSPESASRLIPLSGTNA
jgi:hypothetical protein